MNMHWNRIVIFLMLTICTFGQEEDEPIKLNSSNVQDKPSKIKIANDERDRREPINIDGTIYKVSGGKSSLLTRGTGEGENAILINTGYSVEVRLAQEKTDLIITGPAVANNTFVFTRSIFNRAKTTNGVAGTTILGKNGTALEISVIYYNIKYGSYVEALEHRDGILKIRIRVNTNSNEDNSEFEPFAEIIEKIENPDSVETTMKSNSWYLKYKPTKYYAYAGSMKNATSGVTKPCSITIVLEYELNISQRQFEMFTEIKNSEGEAFVTAEKSYPSDNRLIIHTTEVRFFKDITADETKITSRYM